MKLFLHSKLLQAISLTYTKKFHFAYTDLKTFLLQLLSSIKINQNFKNLIIKCNKKQ